MSCANASSANSTSPPVLVFNAQEWNDFVSPYIRQQLVLLALPFTLYGAFVLLCGASIYSLIRHNSKRTTRTTLLLSLALFVLFSSTTVYIVANYLNIQMEILSRIITDGLGLWGVGYPLIGGTVITVNDPEGPNLGLFPSCGGTGSLTINILLGDAIVCWRAHVLWQGNRGILVPSIMLLLATFGLGTVDTVYTCGLLPGSWQPDSHSDGTGSLYQGLSFGVAATVLSLSTNLFATVAVAFKAWQSRRTLKPYLVMGPMASQVEKLFSLLIESGAVYCTLWIFVVAWQAGTYAQSGRLANLNLEVDRFWYVFDLTINGALVLLIAIYPTIIIVLVALNRSHVENGFATSSQITLGPLALSPPPTGTTNTSVTAHRDSWCIRSSESVLARGEQDVSCGSSREDWSTHMAEQRKHEEMT